MSYKLGLHDTLTTPSEPWDFEKDGDAKQLEKDMIEFMLENKGIGLAANQIGLNKRVFVMGSENIEGFPKPFAVFNPMIVKCSSDTTIDQEGCLSFPNLWLKVKRPNAIIVQYQDSDGNIIESQLEGYISRCFQHEFDHLEGICFVDRVSRLKLDLAMKKVKKRK